MKILKNERQGNLVTLEVEVPYKDLESAQKKTLNEAAKDLKVPGFRKGKAPRSMVEKAFDQVALRNQAVKDLIRDNYARIIDEAKIEPVDYPKLDVKTIAEGKPLVFSIVVEVMPEVKLGKYKGLKVDKLSAQAKEEEVEHALKNLQDRLAKPIEVTDRGIQSGDSATLEVQAEAEGALIKRWPRKLQFLPIGSGYISPEFDKNVEGMKAGESKEFKVSFPPDSKVKEIAGKEVSFKVKLEKIHSKELLPIDDEFAKKVSKFGTLGELREEIKRSLEERKNKEAEADLQNKLIEEASKNAKLELPEAIILTEVQIMLDELKASLSQSNLTLEAYLKAINKTEASLKEELKKPATARATGKLVLQKIAQEEKFVASNDDLNKEIASYARETGQSPEKYRKSLGESTKKFIEDHILRRKALEFMLEHANIKEEKE